MARFERSDEATDTALGSKRLQAFIKAIYDALVPKSGACASVQGELVRANDRITGECLRNGMGNYYDDADKAEDNYYGALFIFVLDTLIVNRNGPLDADDVAYFAAARALVEPDRVRARRIGELEDSEVDLTAAELAELEALAAAPSIRWEQTYKRAERCIANWCLANPELIDREGRPVVEGGVRSIEHIFDPPPSPPPCPLCKGKGWLPPKDAAQFPELCSCKKSAT